MEFIKTSICCLRITLICQLPSRQCVNFLLKADTCFFYFENCNNVYNFFHRNFLPILLVFSKRFAISNIYLHIKSFYIISQALHCKMFQLFFFVLHPIYQNNQIKFIKAKHLFFPVYPCRMVMLTLFLR